MGTDDVVAAVLPDRVHARAAVEELRERGLGTPRLAESLELGERHLLDIDGDALWARSIITGMVAGIPFGSAITYGLVALGTAIAGGSPGDALVPGVLAGSFLGIVLGGAFGIGTAHRSLEITELWSEVDLEGDETLVVVTVDGETRDRVRDVLFSHPSREPELHAELAH